MHHFHIIFSSFSSIQSNHFFIRLVIRLYALIIRYAISNFRYLHFNFHHELITLINEVFIIPMDAVVISFLAQMIFKYEKVLDWFKEFLLYFCYSLKVKSFYQYLIFLGFLSHFNIHQYRLWSYHEAALPFLKFLSCLSYHH